MGHVVVGTETPQQRRDRLLQSIRLHSAVLAKRYRDLAADCRADAEEASKLAFNFELAEQRRVYESSHEAYMLARQAASETRRSLLRLAFVRWDEGAELDRLTRMLERERV